MGTLATTDLDSSDSFTYTVSDNRFEVVSGQLRLKSDQWLDHETEPVVEVTVTTHDAAGATYAELFRLLVLDDVENPNNIALANASVAENSANGTAVGEVSVSDGDEIDLFAFALTDDAGGRFTIDTEGVIRVADGSRLDFESQSSHDVVVQVTDSPWRHAQQFLYYPANECQRRPNCRRRTLKSSRYRRRCLRVYLHIQCVRGC